MTVRALPLALRLFLMILSGSAHADTLLPIGKCAIQVASRPSLSEVQEFVSSYGYAKDHLQVFKAKSGWFAISVGTLNPQQITVVDTWIDSGRIPEDSFCTFGDDYLFEVDFLTGERVAVGTESVRSSVPETGCERPEAQEILQNLPQDLIPTAMQKNCITVMLEFARNLAYMRNSYGNTRNLPRGAVTAYQLQFQINGRWYPSETFVSVSDCRSELFNIGPNPKRCQSVQVLPVE